MNSKTVVFTVIFPGNIPFLNDFVISLNKQSTRDFEVVVANDGIDEPEQYLKGLQVKYTIIEVSGTPAKIREDGIRYLADTLYEFVIFSDSDDILSFNRVEICKDLLNQFAIVCNDLTLVDCTGILLVENYWQCRLAEGFIFGSEFIEDKNILGLGNSAVRREILVGAISIPNNVLAVDWYLFHNLLKERKAVFTSQCQTIYRQHSNNSIGLTPVDHKRLLSILKVKRRHYEALQTAGFLFSRQFKQVVLLINAIEQRPEIVEGYLTLLNSKMLNYFWWEETNYIQ